jgi:hypothetical protein
MNMVNNTTKKEKNMEEEKRSNYEEKKMENILVMTMIRIYVYV